VLGDVIATILLILPKKIEGGVMRLARCALGVLTASNWLLDAPAQIPACDATAPAPTLVSRSSLPRAVAPGAFSPSMRQDLHVSRPAACGLARRASGG